MTFTAHANFYVKELNYLASNISCFISSAH